MSGTVIILTGVVTALAVFALLSKTLTGKPEKAQKREKAEIIKQLLELSARENALSAAAPRPASGRRPAPVSAAPTQPLPDRVLRKPGSERRNPPKSRDSATQLAPDPADPKIQEQIRRRAYELYQARGGEGGTATSDWEQAKEEVLKRKAKSATTSS